MKWLLDAHLPRRLAYRLREAGFDAIHTLDLPLGNATPDGDLQQCADRERRIVVTKDADFVASFRLRATPRRLLLISTGNIRNDALETLLTVHLNSIVAAFEEARFVELTRTALVIHA